MDRKSFSIAILTLTAIILLVACFLPAKPAQAQFAVKDLSRFQLVTVTSQQGGDILYVIDPDGAIAVMGFDPSTKTLRPVAIGSLAAAFGG